MTNKIEKEEIVVAPVAKISSSLETSVDTVIRVTGLNKRFGRKVVLSDLDFSIPSNTIAGFLGPNGAGKTTTLRILLGLLPLQTGAVTLLGERIPQGRVKALENIGAVVENPNFIENFTAIENLYWFGSLYKPVTQNRIMEAIELVGLRGAAKQRFGTFSSGMKQRLGVAFGILHKPSLLILDEPTSGMDPMGRVQMREILQRIHAEEKTSIFLSSHLLDEVQRLCNYVVIIDEGKTRKEGYVKELLSGRQEVWELRIQDEQIPKARELLEKQKDDIVEIGDSPQGLVVTLNSSCSHKINKLLISEGIEIKALIPKEASLEDTFIELTEKTQQEVSK